nr:MAG TPA: hypothetical protein [Caudoviricetes sp.]
MEEKINIAKILKDKPVNTKLYSPLYGDVYFSYIGVRNNIIVLHHRFTLSDFLYNGRYTAYKESEIMLFPSKDMRDWRKFAWKKGDVLVCTDGKAEVIFERFDDDNYTSFVGKHYLESYGKDGDLLDYEQEHIGNTANYTKESDETAQTYINTIEKRLGGKLNRETLEIEKTQPEFKDGDIVYMGNTWNEYIGIIKNRTSGNQIETYAHCHKDSKEEAVLGLWLNKNDSDELRLATNSEKQQLFEALAKKGKRWDSEKKQIVDLKPKYEFKPFDRCIWKIRNCEGSIWQASFVSYVDEHGATPMGKSIDEDLVNLTILPYNDQTKLLVGTTDEWKGGEV